MKNMKTFKSFIAFGILTGMLLTIVLSSSSLEFNYEAPIPLGAEFDLVEGLSQAQKVKAQADYIKIQTQREILENIHYNFVKSINKDKYYSGSYWENYSDDTMISLHILITDLKIVPKLDNQNIFFHEVKYSYEELEKFRETIAEKFMGKEVMGIGIIDKDNKILISIMSSEEHIVDKIPELIPEDSFNYKFIDTVPEIYSTTVTNGGEILNNNTLKTGSIGCPIYFDEGTERVKGWLTAGHFGSTKNDVIKYNGSTLGKVVDTKVTTQFDAATIKRDDTYNTYISSGLVGPFTILYQEEPSSEAPSNGAEVYYKGAKSGGHYGDITNNNWNGIIKINGVNKSFKNLICIEVEEGNCKEGDSGGPVIINDNKMIGIITGGQGTEVYISRLKYIRTEFEGVSVGAFSK